MCLACLEVRKCVCGSGSSRGLWKSIRRMCEKVREHRATLPASLKMYTMCTFKHVFWCVLLWKCTFFLFVLVYHFPKVPFKALCFDRAPLVCVLVLLCVFPSCASCALCVSCATFAFHKICHRVTKTFSLNRSSARIGFSSSFLCCHNIMRKLRNWYCGSERIACHTRLFFAKLTVKSR